MDVTTGSFRHAFSLQLNVIGALVLRELQGRFGRNNIGYLWMVGEPMMLATVISSLHAVSLTGGAESGMAPFPFTLLGYCLFIIFRNNFNRGDHMLEASTPLLYHSMIKPLDIIMSKWIVDVVGPISSLILLMAVGVALGIADLPVRPLYIFLAAALISWLTLGMCMIVAAYTYESHFLSRFVHPFSYFMVPLSGAFVTMDFLPRWAQKFMAWNPMMSIFELARYGQFETASDKHFSFQFVLATCAITSYWGLIAVRRVRSRIHVY